MYSDNSFYRLSMTFLRNFRSVLILVGVVGSRITCYYCDSFHCVVTISSVVVYSMFHFRIKYKQRWRRPSSCLVSL